MRVSVCMCASEVCVYAGILHFLDLRPTFSLAYTLLLHLNFFVILPIRRRCERPLSSSEQTLHLGPVEKGPVLLFSAAQGCSGMFAVGLLAGFKEVMSGTH